MEKWITVKKVREGGLVWQVPTKGIMVEKNHGEVWWLKNKGTRKP